MQLKESCIIMKRVSLRLLALALTLVLCLPVLAAATTSSASRVYYVDTANHKSLNLRSSCDLGDNIIGSIPYRAAVTVYDFYASNTWVWVEYNGKSGYVMSRYLSPWQPAVDPGQGGSDTAISYANFQPTFYTVSVRPSNPSGYVNMRWAPSKSTAVHQIYYAGEVLQVIADNGTWCQVYDTSRNLCGFMMKEFLTILSFGAEAN